MRVVPALWCLAAAALFGASTPVAKSLLGGMGPLTLAGLLYLGAGLATAPFARTGGSPVARDRRNVSRLAGAVLFGGVLGPVALLVGLKAAPAASVALWLNLETTATAVLAYVLFKEHLDARMWLANGLVLLSGVLLVAPNGFEVAPAAALVVLACVCWGIDNNLTAVIDGYTPAQTTCVKGLAAGALNLGLGLWFEGGLPGVAAVVGALVAGSLAYGASIVLYIRGAQQLGATRSQMLFATAPFVGVLVAWLAFGDGVLAVQAVAAVGMAVALGVMFVGRHEHEHRHEAAVHTHAHRHDDGHHDHVHEGLSADTWHTHEHQHTEVVHKHAHVPDLHHRHTHG